MTSGAMLMTSGAKPIMMTLPSAEMLFWHRMLCLGQNQCPKLLTNILKPLNLNFSFPTEYIARTKSYL